MARSNRTRLVWALAALAAGLTNGAAAASPPDAAPRPQLRAFKPVADSYVSSFRPERNYGRARILRVDGAPETRAYLRFDLTKLKGEIESVTLLLHPSTAARASYAVRRVREDDWRERRLTYENAPEPSMRYTTSKPIRRGVWSAIDVTPFVGDDGEEISLAITTRSARELSFGSRESAHGPRLVVRLERDRADDLDDLMADAFR